MELVLIRGLPGSGKTTKAAEFARSGYIHCEADHYFEDDCGNYVFNPALLPQAHKACQSKAREALALGLSVVVANTFTQAWEVQPYIDMAKEAGASIKVLVCSGEYGSIHGVPASAIERMRSRWESIENL